jgi:hypothetical protein
MTQFNLPAAVSAYVASTNASDLDALVATFAENALVNDHRNEFAGRSAIRAWAQREIIGDRITMQVTSATSRGSAIAVTANLDGDFDKTALPTPLVLAFYFSISGDRIVQLVIVHNKPAA